jgi:hypothetical protein
MCACGRRRHSFNGSAFPTLSPARKVFTAPGSDLAGHPFFLETIMRTIIALAIALASTAALARDDGRYANSPNKEWFSNQRNSVGQWCCNEADGHFYEGDYEIKADGSIEAEGHTIEAYKVLKDANPTGRAVWWYVDTPYGRNTFCFIPGPMT